MNARLALAPLCLLLALPALADSDGPFYSGAYETGAAAPAGDTGVGVAPVTAGEDDQALLPASTLRAGKASLDLEVAEGHGHYNFWLPPKTSGRVHRYSTQESGMYRQALDDTTMLLLGLRHTSRDAFHEDFADGTTASGDFGHKLQPSVGVEHLFTERGDAFQATGALLLSTTDEGNRKETLMPVLNLQYRCAPNLTGYGWLSYLRPLSDQWTPVAVLAAGLQWRWRPALSLFAERQQVQVMGISGVSGHSAWHDTAGLQFRLAPTRLLRLSLSTSQEAGYTYGPVKFASGSGGAATVEFYDSF